MENTKWVDAVLNRKNKNVKMPRNLIIDNAWEDLKAGKISPFQYNERFRQAEKLNRAPNAA